MELKPANQWGVGIYVFPGDDADEAASVEKVTITRGTQTIEPKTTTIAPIAKNAHTGRRKQLANAYFAFSMDAFDPGSDVTITFSGADGNTVCTLDREALSALH